MKLILLRKTLKVGFRLVFEMFNHLMTNLCHFIADDSMVKYRLVAGQTRGWYPLACLCAENTYPMDPFSSVYVCQLSELGFSQGNWGKLLSNAVHH